MRLTRSSASIVGALPLLPLIFFLAFAAYIQLKSMSVGMPGGTPFVDFVRTFNTVFRAQIGVMLLDLAILVYYYIYLIRTGRVQADKKRLWGGLFFLCNILAMLTFWYLYMWPRNSGAAQHVHEAGAPGRLSR